VCCLQQFILYAGLKSLINVTKWSNNDYAQVIKNELREHSTMKLTWKLVASSLLVTGLIATPVVAKNSSIRSYQFEANFKDALFDLKEALTNKGLVVDHEARVANMLNRTAKDVGATKTVYKNGMVVEFCSATLSRRAMEADPLNMAFCPYTMFVYETVANPGHVTVGYKILDGATTKESKKALDDVNKIMDSMTREAAGLE